MPICARCNGQGSISCTKCGGDGTLKDGQLELLTGQSRSPQPCPECKGAGTVVCPDCEGSGDVIDDDD